MASAVKTQTVVVPEKVIPAEVRTTYTLVLSEKEALALSALCGQVGGTSNPRQTLDNIYYALDKAGITGSFQRNGRGVPAVSITIQEDAAVVNCCD